MSREQVLACHGCKSWQVTGSRLWDEQQGLDTTYLTHGLREEIAAKYRGAIQLPLLRIRGLVVISHTSVLPPHTLLFPRSLLYPPCSYIG